MCQTLWPHFVSTTRTIIRPTLLLAAIGLIGCGRNTPEATPASNPPAKSETSAEKPFKIALVTPGPVSDNGWNAGAYKGLQAAKEAVKATDSQNVEAKTPAEQEDNVRQYAQKGFNLVFCHGAEFEDLALKIEKDFPNTVFAISSGRKAGKNTTPIILNLEDGAYLLGMAAAGMSKTNKLAQVGAMKSVPVESVFKAFEAGAKAVKPNITIVAPVYTNSWEDVGAAKQATLALLDQGADVIIQNVDSAAAGVFQAVQERAKTGKVVYALGTNSDQNSVAPDVILASAPIYSDKVFVEIAKQVKDGKFAPNTAGFGMKGGYVDFVLNPQLEAKFPADLKAKLAETKKKIEDGSFAVPKGGS